MIDLVKMYFSTTPSFNRPVFDFLRKAVQPEEEVQLEEEIPIDELLQEEPQDEPPPEEDLEKSAVPQSEGQQNDASAALPLLYY